MLLKFIVSVCNILFNVKKKYLFVLVILMFYKFVFIYIKLMLMNELKVKGFYKFWLINYEKEMLVLKVIKLCVVLNVW